MMNRNPGGTVIRRTLSVSFLIFLITVGGSILFFTPLLLCTGSESVLSGSPLSENLCIVFSQLSEAGWIFLIYPGIAGILLYLLVSLPLGLLRRRIRKIAEQIDQCSASAVPVRSNGGMLLNETSILESAVEELMNRLSREDEAGHPAIAPKLESRMPPPIPARKKEKVITPVKPVRLEPSLSAAVLRAGQSSSDLSRENLERLEHFLEQSDRFLEQLLNALQKEDWNSSLAMLMEIRAEAETLFAGSLVRQANRMEDILNLRIRDKSKAGQDSRAGKGSGPAGRIKEGEADDGKLMLDLVQSLAEGFEEIERFCEQNMLTGDRDF